MNGADQCWLGVGPARDGRASQRQRPALPPGQRRRRHPLDGKAAGATTIARKRSAFANVIRYAVELEEMPSNPLDRLSWTPPKVSEVVDAASSSTRARPGHCSRL
jgi:hypothetical protein